MKKVKKSLSNAELCQMILKSQNQAPVFTKKTFERVEDPGETHGVTFIEIQTTKNAWIKNRNHPRRLYVNGLRLGVVADF